MAQVAEATYSTGRFAKLFKTSSYHVRKLLEAGLLDGELTDAQRWQIPVSQAARFEKSGLPPIPQTSSENASPRAKFANGRPALLGAPSEDLIASAEDVLATENLLKKRRLEWELVEVGDKFAERELAAADQEAERAYLEQSRLARDQASQERDESVRGWEAHALGLVPQDAPPELSLQIQAAVRDRLLSLSPMPAPLVSRQIVESLVSRLLAPWLHGQDIMAVLIEARDGMLPAAARRSAPPVTVWQSRAIRAAAAAIGKLRDDAPLEEIRAAAKEAVAQVAAEFEHQRMCEEIASQAWLSLRDETSEERQQARELVAQALEQFPVGSTRKQLESARDAALDLIREVIAERQAQAQAEQQRRQAELQAAEGRKWAMVLASQERADHQASKRDILTTLQWSLPWDSGAALTPEATAAVAKALDQLPVPASWEAMVQARDAALKPYIAAHEQRQRKERVIASALRELPSCLRKLEHEWDFEGATVESLAQQFRGAVRAALEKELIGTESADYVARRVRQLVRKQLETAPAAA